MPDFLPSWISTEQFAVLTEILEAMNRAQLPFQATGGLAGNLHGSVWPLHDLDFDVAPPLLSRMATEFRAQVVYGPAPFRDEEFALDLLTLRFGSVEVDLSDAASIRLLSAGGEEQPWPTDLTAVVWRPLGHHTIPAMPLPQLLAYKRAIGREADVADLMTLRGAWHVPG